MLWEGGDTCLLGLEEAEVTKGEQMHVYFSRQREREREGGGWLTFLANANSWMVGEEGEEGEGDNLGLMVDHPSDKCPFEPTLHTHTHRRDK